MNKVVQKHIINVLLALIAFVIPLVASILLFKGANYYPFAKDGHSLAMIDMQGQYIPFFRYYKRILDGEYNLLYTLGKVTGGDFLSIFLYYLASPFNLLLKFFPLSELPKALMIIIVLKIATTGLISYLVLSKINKNNYINLLLSISYALIAYNFVYYSNLMWLDGVIALPLVVYGIIKIKADQSPLFYILSLSYAIMTSWYIGIMICIFAVLFFLTTVDGKEVYGKVLLKRVLSFAGGSLLAGIISFAFWGTAILNILGTKGGSSFTNLAVTIREHYDLLDLKRAFLLGTHTGMPDISGTGYSISFYVGVIPLILTILYFFNKKFIAWQRVSAGIIFFIYLLAFNNKGIDHLFHGGPAPNWFPSRHAFIFGFLLIFYGAKTLANFKSQPWWSFLVPLFIYIVLVLNLKYDGYVVASANNLYFFLTFTLLIIVYALNFVLTSDTMQKMTFKQIATPVVISGLTVVALLNVYGNNAHILTALNDTVTHLPMEKYRDDEEISDVVNFVKAYDTSLYRMEKSFIRSGTYNNADNDALYFGYNGISHYSSSEKFDVNNYMKKIGFHYNSFNLNYANGSTLAMNSYLGLKYFIDKGTNRNFDFVRYLDKVNYDSATYHVYTNKYVLPFLMSTRPHTSTYIGEGKWLNATDVYWFDMFEYQNHLFKGLTGHVVDEHGNQKDIFKKATVNRTLSPSVTNTSDYRYNVTNNGTITYNVTLDKATNYYYYIATSNRNDLTLSENGMPLTYFSYHGYQINGIRNDRAQTTLRVSINAPRENVEIKEAIYYEDLDVLNEYISAIRNQVTIHNVIQKNTAHYRSEITTKVNNQHMLITLPRDPNLRVFLDGKKIETALRFNIYTGFVVETAGNHTIDIQYIQYSYQVGLPLGIFVFGTVVIMHFKLKNTLYKKETDEETN